MDSKLLVKKIEQLLDDKKAVDIEVLSIAEKTVLADYFVICSGTSTTHIKSLAEEVEYVLKTEDSIIPAHIEGEETSRWILLDYKDVVVHVFHPEERAEYSLEQLWNMKKPDPMIES